MEYPVEHHTPQRGVDPATGGPMLTVMCERGWVGGRLGARPRRGRGPVSVDGLLAEDGRLGDRLADARAAGVVHGHPQARCGVCDEILSVQDPLGLDPADDVWRAVWELIEAERRAMAEWLAARQ